MIACEFKQGRITCSREAVITVAVKRRSKVIFIVHVCDPHLHTARHEALGIAASKGGRMDTLPIVPVVRASKDDPLVNVGAVIPRSEFAPMVLAAQHLRMSQRAFVRMAINNQVSMIDFSREASSDDQQT